MLNYSNNTEKDKQESKDHMKSNHLAIFANAPLKSIFPHDSLWFRDFPVTQMVKNLPAMQESRVWSLGWEVPLAKGMAIHSRILAWRIPWTEKPGGLQSVGLQSRTCRHTHTHTLWFILMHVCTPSHSIIHAAFYSGFFSCFIKIFIDI